MTHKFDGSLHDGWCADCGKPYSDPVHVKEGWHESWVRSLKFQGRWQYSWLDKKADDHREA